MFWVLIAPICKLSFMLQSWNINVALIFLAHHLTSLVVKDLTSCCHFSSSQSLHWSSIVPTKVIGAYCSSMDAFEPTFEHQPPSPSTHQDGCCKQFKLGLRSCYNKLITLCHFSFVSLSCKDDKDCVKGILFEHNHKLSNRAHLGQVGIVKWIGVETMKVWLDLDLGNPWTFVLTSVVFKFMCCICI